LLHRLRSRLTYANLLTIAAVFLALGGGAYAIGAIPDSNGVIHACVKKKSGTLRAVKGTKCRKKERPISWNRTGPPGSDGARGKDGTDGVDGSPAASTISGNSDVTLDLNIHRLPLSGFTPSASAPTTAEGWSQPSPNATVVLRDLYVRIPTAPGTNNSRFFAIVRTNPTIAVLICSISGSATTCDSGTHTATVEPGTDLHFEATTEDSPAGSVGVRWAFREETP
jgi:hypothetical protein